MTGRHASLALLGWSVFGYMGAMLALLGVFAVFH